MKIFAMLVPAIFLLSLLVAAIKKVKIFDAFSEGVSGAIPLICSIFPYLVTMTMLSKLLEVSGVESRVCAMLAPTLERAGVPQEILKLVFIKPLSGSASTAVLAEIVTRCGVDSYAARCACVVFASGETVFYVGAVYFAGQKQKRLTAALIISLFSYFLSVLLGCFLCRLF